MLRPILTSVAVVGFTAPVLADTIQVLPTDSIQTAIDSATDGDLIEVAPGTYYETIDFLGKAITVRSTGGQAVTTIDATGMFDSAVRSDKGEWTDTVFDGFTVTGGTGMSFGGKTYGGGMIIMFSDPTVRNCTFTGNHADAGGGMSLWGMSFNSIENCRFVGNTASVGGSYGGGGMLIKNGNARLVNCTFDGNSAVGTARGGGLRVALGSHELTNCLFVGNSAYHGGAIANHQSDLALTNCTVAGNSASASGGGMRAVYASAQTVATNSIFWNNSAADGSHEILDVADAATTVQYSTVQGGWSGDGANVAGSDPLFVDASGGNYRLGATSPCIDAGDESAVTETSDLDGNDRVVNGAVDVGAYETQDTNGAPCIGDVNVDGMVGLDDLVALLGAWGPCPGCPEDVDGDSQVDLDDLLQLLFRWGPCP